MQYGVYGRKSLNESNNGMDGPVVVRFERMIQHVLRVRLWAVVSEVCAVYSLGSGIEKGRGVNMKCVVCRY